MIDCHSDFSEISRRAFLKQSSAGVGLLTLGAWGMSGCRSFADEVPAEDQMLLSGTWKFNALFGEGYSYHLIKKGPDDTVVDNSDTASVSVNGDWRLSSKETRGGVPFIGGNYLRHNFVSGDRSTHVRYHSNGLEPGFYEHLICYPFSLHLTAQVNVVHASGTERFQVNQRALCGEWVSLGVFEVSRDSDCYIEITATTEGRVIADAVMFRPVSRDLMEQTRREKEQVFLPSYKDADWYDLKVPGHWGMINEFSNYTGKAWYRKSFGLPRDWRRGANERFRLQFDGVYHLARVFLNGRYLGRNQGGFTRFEFDVTDHLRGSGPNVIALEADNNYLVGATWNWGGIIRDVRLIRDKQVRIVHQHMHAVPDLETGRAKLLLRVKIHNDASETKQVQLSSTIIFKGEKLATLEEAVSINSTSTVELELEAELPAEVVRLWHFDTPYLYRFKTAVAVDQILLDEQEERFGIRKIELDASHLYLNGEPVRLSGYNRVSDHRYWGSSEPQELIDQDIDLMKEAGANFTRIMHGAQNKKLIERCDEKGILIFEEVNVRMLTNAEFTAPDYPLIRQWLRGMIERDINHPSIIGWSVGNELSDHYDYAKRMIEFVKTELDPHRLLTCVSNTGWRKEATRANDPNTVVDIILHNHYPYQGEAGAVLDTLREKWPEKPIFVSEFGLRRLPSTSLDETVPELRQWNDSIRGQRTFVIGNSLWTFNDYRSNYVGTTAEENRTWGLVNVWRQKRRFYALARKEYSALRDMRIEDLNLENGSANVVMDLRARDDYPSYSMNGYRLAFALRDRLGNRMVSGNLKLPVLNPEANRWEGPIVWKPGVTEPFDMVVELMTPSGYSRHEAIVRFEAPQAPKITSVVSGDEALRVNFESVYGADEYYVRYKDAKGTIRATERSIQSHIDVSELENGVSHSVQVVACNRHGDSEPSEHSEGSPNGSVLPPVVWDAFIADGKLVVGYSGESEDETYTIRYGKPGSALKDEITTRNRGMLTAFVGDRRQIAFRIKRSGAFGESNWSNTVVGSSRDSL